MGIVRENQEKVEEWGNSQQRQSAAVQPAAGVGIFQRGTQHRRVCGKYPDGLKLDPKNLGGDIDSRYFQRGAHRQWYNKQHR